MTAPLRRAGSGRAPDGAHVTWSVAEGNRGRRWRWTVIEAEGSVRHAGLIELDVPGAFARLELASASGLLTLHPAGDGRTAHGNVVRSARVDHIEVGLATGDGIGIVGDAFGSSLRTGSTGEGWMIGEDLGLVAGGASGSVATLDDRGIPVLADAAEWALETD